MTQVNLDTRARWYQICSEGLAYVIERYMADELPISAAYAPWELNWLHLFDRTYSRVSRSVSPTRAGARCQTS